MGATKVNEYQKRVNIEYHLTDGNGYEFTLGVTASVEDNGPEYPPSVLIESASWDTTSVGTFEKLCDVHSLPVKMQGAIWAKCIEEADKKNA
jgi:hypothetical protein